MAVDLRKWLPDWAVASREPSEDAPPLGADMKALARACGVQTSETKQSTLTLTQWQVALERRACLRASASAGIGSLARRRYSLAANALEQLNRQATIVHRDICMRVAMKAQAGRSS